jgi:hypothetical protein
MHSNPNYLVVAATICIGCISASCQTSDEATAANSTPTAQPSTPSTTADHPPFSWREALGASASALSTHLGEQTGDGTYDCRPTQSLRDGLFKDAPARQTLIFPTGCHFSNSSDNNEGGAYVIDGVRYHQQRAPAVRLKPRTSLSMSAVPDGRFDLPETPFRRSFRVVSPSDGEKIRRVDAYRAAKRPSKNPSDPVGFDVVSKPGEFEKVDYIQVYNGAVEPLVAIIRIRGPVAGRDDMVLPVTNATHSDIGEPAYRSYLEIRHKDISIGVMPSYPDLPPPKRDTGITELTFSHTDVLQAAVSQDPWRDVYEFLEARRQQTRQLIIDEACPNAPEERTSCATSISAERGVTLAVDSLVPFGLVTETTDALWRMKHGELNLLAWADAALESKPTGLSAGLRGINLKPLAGNPPIMSYIGLEVTPDGIDVYSDGKKIDPIDECEQSGRTVCVRHPDAVSRRLDQLKDRRNGTEVSPETLASKWATLTDMYRPSALYNSVIQARNLAERDDPSTMMFIVSVEPSMPTGLVSSLLDQIRYVRTADPTDSNDCWSPIPSDAFADSTPCQMGDTDDRINIFTDVTLMTFDETWRPPNEHRSDRRPQTDATEALKEQNIEESTRVGGLGLSKEEKPGNDDAQKESSDGAKSETGDDTDQSDKCLSAVDDYARSKKSRAFFVSLEQRAWRTVGVIRRNSEGIMQPMRVDVLTPEQVANTEVRLREIPLHDPARIEQVTCVTLGADRWTAFKVRPNLRAIGLQGLAARAAWSVDSDGEEGSTLYIHGAEPASDGSEQSRTTVTTAISPSS